ncbi:hypothetical protein B0A48_13367 [Cryoendolithus antarcticus]|uniref:peptidyl-tRNA hydrolase n=1 Tax=Cryoendolithus antarcticus TaxID=1507870 RepID=A0A1V8SPZ9_9PEZI|nr:hypothetical protein B0A48_13367 [Cryoendolithus antarcticus]
MISIAALASVFDLQGRLLSPQRFEKSSGVNMASAASTSEAETIRSEKTSPTTRKTPVVEGQRSGAGGNVVPRGADPRLRPPMPAGRSVPLLICSIGNPGPYLNTLHSAGHTVLSKVAEAIRAPPFRKDRALGNGLVSNATSPHSGSQWVLWQSTSLMNVSGAGLKAAYNSWSKSLPEGEAKLVVIHDELEKPLGAVSVKVKQGASAKGHNGLKSILASMGGKPFVRIGIGIGRPISREPNDVAEYVLRKMTPEQRMKVEGCVEEVIKKLNDLESG